jgi:crotonobetainyl-CoA:carnitine CoA-transferase CaiB-like acyl-CoA transferase
MLPLEGVTVVALEQAVAAPLATRNLADLGARVIKVERVAGGDLARGYDHVVHGSASHFVWLNRGKESLAVDLKNEQGVGAVRELIAKSDVVVQNLAPGAAARLGLDAATLRADHDSLIVVTMSGYGAGGPFAHHKAYDMLIQAEAGLISLTGTAEHPAKTGIPTSDIAAGMYAAQAVLAALVRRGVTGAGAAIDISMLEATVEWMGHALYTQLYTGTPPPRMGVSHAAIAPYDAYPTSDGQMLIGVQSDPGWRDLVVKALDAPELADDERFTTNVLRVRHRADCDAAVAERTRRYTTDELADRLLRAGVPAAQLKEIGDVIGHPQLQARDRWRSVTTEFATIEALLPPATFDDFEAPMGGVPALGQHTRKLLSESGLTDEQIDELVAEGVVAEH